MLKSITDHLGTFKHYSNQNEIIRSQAVSKCSSWKIKEEGYIQSHFI